MSDSHWERVKDILHRALQLAPHERRDFLDQTCAGEDEVRKEVESLLSADRSLPDGFLDSPPAAPLSEGEGAAVITAGQIIAQRFKLVRKLGEGGMGQVWLAEQTEPVRRTVALKLIRAGMYDEAVVQRFRAERQSLAIMDHPAIAKVFDAGTTLQGQPYLVMEYVAGQPITTYCDEKRLGINARLELFIQVCEGVQHAHQKAIIHRDLKPANVLIVEVDGKPVPRIIDFGLAKAISTEPGEPAAHTRMGHFLGTPGYMSPEQLDPEIHDVDTRADVYALGAILYMLLTGSLPFERRGPQRQPLHELLRRIREDDPLTPSARLADERNTATADAEARDTQVKQLIGTLRGDLDWIAMKALERERTRRYATPSELAADLRRYLVHEPVTARPDGTAYRARKYLRRHRLGAAVTAGALLLLTGFSLLEAIELRRTTQQRDRANRERDRATRITEFMTGIFKVADPSEARGNSVTAREILDKASNDVRSGLGQDPQVRAQMMQVMASTYMNLGLYPRARELTQAALDAQLALLGPASRETLTSRAQLAWITTREGHPAAAEPEERAVLADEQRILGRDDPLTLDTMVHLASTLQRRDNYRGEEDLAREIMQISARRRAPESLLTLQARGLLAGSLFVQHRLADAEQAYRELLDADRRVLGPDHPDTLKTMTNLGITISFQYRHADAEPLFREALAREQRVLGPQHDVTLMTRAHLGHLLRQQGHGAEAEELDRGTWAAFTRTVGANDWRTFWSEASVARDLLLEGDPATAERLQREALTGLVRVAGTADTNAVDARTGLAEVLIREGRWAEAEPLARESVAQAPHSRNPLAIADAMRALGISLVHENRYDEASKLFRDILGQSQDPEVRAAIWYAYACTAAVAEDTDGALGYLHEALNAGYRDLDKLALDTALQSVRDNPRFRRLVADLKSSPGNAVSLQ